jgi:hypothetical protein
MIAIGTRALLKHASSSSKSFVALSCDLCEILPDGLDGRHPGIAPKKCANTCRLGRFFGFC